MDRDDTPACWEYWTETNLKTACPDCHKRKNKIEAKERGKTRRLIKKQGPKIKPPPTEWQIKAKQRQKDYSKQQRERIKAMKPKKPKGKC